MSAPSSGLVTHRIVDPASKLACAECSNRIHMALAISPHPPVREALARVTRCRLDYLESCYVELGQPRREARQSVLRVAGRQHAVIEAAQKTLDPHVTGGCTPSHVRKKTSFTVSEIARMANISVRALHHYDEIGLLRPSGRSQAGYRLYAPADLQRLQQVMSFKVLGFPLEEIRRLLSDPEFDVRAALLLQRRLLAEKAEQVQTLIAAVDAALAALTKGSKEMDGVKMFEPFGEFDSTLYEEEAKERWGHTDAYRESAKRTARYTKEQWAELKEESDCIYRELAAQLEAGASPTDAAVMDLAERHRLHIERWFYPCTKDLHRGVAELYVADSRFAKNIDAYRPGLASFLHDAISANRDRGTKVRKR